MTWPLRVLPVFLLHCTVAWCAQTTEHVPPDAPQQLMADMPYASMVSMMQMDDQAAFGTVAIDELEWRRADADVIAWDAQLRYGNDFHKVLFTTAGELQQGDVEQARLELLWDHIVTRWWSSQVGVRTDTGSGHARTWVEVGVAGLAPFWFDIETTLAMSDAGHAAAYVKIEYDLRCTLKWVLQPVLEADWYSRTDAKRGLGAGLSSVEGGLRLRYEWYQEFAPYVGVLWSRKFADTATQARALGQETNSTQVVAGLRMWF